MNVLRVDRTQFLVAILQTTVIVSRRRQAKAVFTFGDGFLKIKVANNTCEIHADGDWPGTAKIRADFLLKVLDPPPVTDTVTLTVRDGRFYMERVGTVCEWTPH
jgi:hypothetical protein